MSHDSRPTKIKVANLAKHFGKLLVLDKISFDVAKGEFLSIVGPTGCGKTTFLNCLSKLIPASEGNIFIDGEVADPEKHNISFVFQEPTCRPWRTVRDNVPWRKRGMAQGAALLRDQIPPAPFSQEGGGQLDFGLFRISDFVLRVLQAHSFLVVLISKPACSMTRWNC
jgi:ABC-type uncharacterized transport system ATPase subunit